MRDADIAMGSALSIVGRLANVYHSNPCRYESSDPTRLAQRFHADLRDQVGLLLRGRICTYVASVFADICQTAGAGDVVVIRGDFTSPGAPPVWHHWNFDRERNLYIDTMLGDPLTFHELPPNYRISARDLTPSEVLGIEISPLKLCAPS
jgi:hypothetical protein